MLTATVDGAAWSPDAGALDLFGLLQSGRAFISARRVLDGGQTEERLQIEFDTADPFRSASYRLTGGPAAFATFIIQSGPSTGAVYGTGPQHTGAIAIQAADATDSVVAGSFSFEAQELGGTAVRRIAGQFRVRYRTTVPLGLERATTSTKARNTKTRKNIFSASLPA